LRLFFRRLARSLDALCGRGQIHAIPAAILTLAFASCATGEKLEERARALREKAKASGICSLHQTKLVFTTAYQQKEPILLHFAEPTEHCYARFPNAVPPWVSLKRNSFYNSRDRVPFCIQCDKEYKACAEKMEDE
jgi:hypothetical protein